MGTEYEKLEKFEKRYEDWFMKNFDQTELPPWSSIEGNIYWIRYSYQFAIDLLKLIEEKFDNKKINILDLGCGKGFLSFLLSQLPNITVYSTDVVKNKYIDLFIKDNPQEKINYSINHNNKLPYKDNFFDIVLLIEVIEHERQPLELIKSSLKVTKNNGLLVVTTPPRFKFLFKKDPHFRIKYLYWLPIYLQDFIIEKILKLNKEKEYYDYKVYNIFSNIFQFKKLCKKSSFKTKIEVEPQKSIFSWKMIKIIKLI